jgi:monovalent cation/hydrogen antiporter
VLLGVLAAVTVLAATATRLGAPYPVVVVLGGLAIAVVPGAPVPRVEPDLVLLAFLPPILYAASFSAPLDELRARVRPIGALAVGLVAVTVGVVAVVSHHVAGLPWEAAFVLGAVLGPTDPVAATAVIGRLGAPQRIGTVLEGESLVNDATGITAYTLALGASFSVVGVLETFGLSVAVGVAIGLAVAWVIGHVRVRIQEVEIQLALSVLTPFAAYLPAEQLGVSGVLGAVAAGLYSGRRSLRALEPATRLQLLAFWRLLVFVLNAVLFLLLGAQLPYVLEGLGGGIPVELVGQGALVALAVVAARFAWVWSVPAVLRLLRRDEAAHAWGPHQQRLVIAWSGMRGAVSLALALAVPEDGAGGKQAELLVLAFTAIVLTLVVPGLTLGPLLRRLGLEQTEEQRRQATEVRAHITNFALQHLDEMAEQDHASEAAIRRLRETYEARLEQLNASLDDEEDEQLADDNELRRDVVTAQREEIRRLAAERAYPSAVLIEVREQLDLRDSAL